MTSRVNHKTSDPAVLDLIKIIETPQEILDAIFAYDQHRGFEASAEETEKLRHR